MERNPEVRLISSMFSLYFHYSIYVFNTEEISGSPDRKLLKQSICCICCTFCFCTQTPFSVAAQEGHRGTCALVQFQGRAHVMIYHKATSLLSC